MMRSHELTRTRARACGLATSQAKFKHFEVADNKKYQEVWAMHEQEVADLVTKLLHADKILHEQQLGSDHFPPPPRFFDASSTATHRRCNLATRQRCNLPTLWQSAAVLGSASV